MVPIILIVGPALWLTYTALSESSVTCEVCVEFNEKTNCAKASGENRLTCQTTATDTACALVASGVQQSIQCSQKKPASVKFD